MSLPVPVSWFGGKTHLREFILPHLEDSSRIYVEAFCGSANIFFAKRSHEVEVLNDLNGDIVNFFRVLQSRRQFRHFAHRVHWTPFAVEEFQRAIDILETPPTPDLSLDRAWAFFVRGSLGFSGAGESRGNWRRSFNSTHGQAEVVSNWRMRVNLLEAWRDRLLRTQIDQKNALELIQYWDDPEAVFYLDPPYVEDTRITLNYYTHEMSYSDHDRLVNVLLGVKGRVVLSGYLTSLYAPLERAGWTRLDKKIFSHMAWKRGEDGRTGGSRQPRTECLWINRAGAEGNLWEEQVLIEVPQPEAPPAPPEILPAPVERWTEPTPTAWQGSLFD